MSRLRHALDRVADRAPEVHVPAGFYRRSRRRHRLRQAAAALSVVAVAAAGALVLPSLVKERVDRVGGIGSPGLPDRLVMPPATTDTVSRSPAGPASVVFTGSGVPQADHEDYDVAWWRSDYTVYPSVAVGLISDTYRIVRGPYTVGAELSPDGRYLITQDGNVLDLTTARNRTLPGVRPDSFHDAAWTADGTRIVFMDDTVTTVLEWPSLAERARFSHPMQHPVAQDLALSPDGSRLAVHSNELVRVYRADGSLVWSKAQEGPSGRLRIGGRAAWKADDRLAVFDRTDLTCADCGVHPGTWHLAFADLDGTITDTTYPVVRDALEVDIVAWRGDDAYAVVRYSRNDLGDTDRVDLIRLRPGAPGYDRLLTAPSGADSMQVATEFVDAFRPTGDPAFGYNGWEAVGGILNGVVCLSPFLLVIGVALWLRRRARGPSGLGRSHSRLSG